MRRYGLFYNQRQADTGITPTFLAYLDGDDVTQPWQHVALITARVRDHQRAPSVTVDDNYVYVTFYGHSNTDFKLHVYDRATHALLYEAGLDLFGAHVSPAVIGGVYYAAGVAPGHTYVSVMRWTAADGLTLHQGPQVSITANEYVAISEPRMVGGQLCYALTFMAGGSSGHMRVRGVEFNISAQTFVVHDLYDLGPISLPYTTVPITVDTSVSPPRVRSVVGSPTSQANRYHFEYDYGSDTATTWLLAQNTSAYFHFAAAGQLYTYGRDAGTQTWWLRPVVQGVEGDTVPGESYNVLPVISALSTEPLHLAAAAEGGAILLVRGRPSAAHYDANTLAALTVQPLATDTSVYGSAQLAATAQLVANPVIMSVASADIAATAQLAATGTVVLPAAAAITATAAITASAQRLTFAAATLAGTATLAATGQHAKTGAAALQSVATLTASGARQVTGHASLSATATLASDATVTAALQRKRPVRTTINTGWVNEVGGSEDLHLSVAGDEANYDTWAQSSQPPGDEKFGTGFDLLAPVSRAGHSITVVAGKYPAEDGQPIQLNIQLTERDNVIASWTWPDLPLVGEQTFTLTEQQASQIVIYSDVEARFTAEDTAGGASRGARVYWVEIQTPAAITDAHAALLGQAQLAADARVVKLAAANLASAATVVASGALVAWRGAGLLATASLAADALRLTHADADLAATASLAADATRGLHADATLTASGSIAATGSLVRRGEAALQAQAALDAAGVRVALADASITATAALAADLSGTLFAAAQLAGAATLVADGSTVGQVAGAANLAATAQVDASGGLVLAAAAALSGSASIEAAGTRQRLASASLPASATLAGTGHRTRLANAAMAATAALAAQGTRTTLATADLVASAAVAATGTRVRATSATLNASAQLVAAAQRTRLAAATLDAAATLTGAGLRVARGAASLPAAAALTAALTDTAITAAHLAASATLSAAANVIRHGEATLAAAATLDAIGIRTRRSTADLAAAATLDAEALRQRTAAAGLPASAALTADLTLVTPTLTGAAELHATAQLDALGMRRRSGNAELPATASLIGEGSLLRRASATLAATATLAADLQFAESPGATLAAIATLTAHATRIAARRRPRSPQALHYNPHDPDGLHRRKGGPT